MARLIALSQLLARFVGKSNRQRRRDLWLRLLRRGAGCRLLFFLCGKQVRQMRFDSKTRLDGVAGSISLDFGGINVEFFSPHQASLLTLLHNLLKEAAKDINSVALANTG